MSRPLQHLCLQVSHNVLRGWVALPLAVLLLGTAACGGTGDSADTGTGTELDIAGDTDVKIKKDTKDADTEATDVETDVTDADLPDGTDADGTDALTGDTDGLPDGTDVIDTALPDTTDDVDTTIGPDAPDTPDVKPEVNQCDYPPTALPGTPGAKCSAAGDCDSGYCVDTPNGKVCTGACADSCCPGGWQCKNLSQSAEPWYGCVPTLVHPCDPCTDDAQCHSPGDPNGLCVSYGDVGTFCGGTCDKGLDSECPSGYYCLKNAKGTANGVPGTGGTGNQCMKLNGQCECSITAKAQGLSTVCLSKNKYGTCTGGRQCQPGGLTGCDAKSPTAEVCNGLDDNCDGGTDEPGASLCSVYWKDSDKDGFGNSPATGGDNQCLCKAVDLYSSTSPSDCDDQNNLVKPSAIEVCDGIDNDCNGKTDETCDADKDGYCAADAIILPGSKTCKYKGADCDDGNPKIHPGQPEVCGNSIDDDCDSTTDQGVDGVGCNLFYEDGDKDGVGTFNSICACAVNGIFTADTSGDCNDSNKNVFPGNKEVCGNGIDDNCNGKQDEEGALNCSSFYKDADSDGYGAGKAACLCGMSATYTTNKGNDCNDSDAKMNPAMTEVCNNIDDDCDGVTDNNNALGCTTFYADYDKDGFGDSKKALCLCAAFDKFTATKGGDCDDSKSNVSPIAPETCDALDNDCNGLIDDPGAQGCVMAFKDADGDGFGDPLTKACVCGLQMPYNTFKGDDCDDKLASVFPSGDKKQEKCNGIDDNCSGTIDEEDAAGCTIYYKDSDYDGIGNAAAAKCLCAKNGTYTTTKNGDCNDSDPTIKPGNSEACDGKDNDCDGTIDNPGAIGCNTYYQDKDNDGYGDITTVAKCFCTATDNYTVLQGGDCKDDNSGIHPGVPEKCDALDNDCDGTVDPVGAIGCFNYYPDLDNDGYGDLYASTWACQCGPLYPNTSTQAAAKDCNDKSPLVSPGAFEICGDGIDNNCNSATDEPTTNTVLYIDNDGDGYGAGPGQVLCKPGTVNGQYFSVSQAGDCNDALKDVHPSAQEACNAIDDDCNGKTDEQLPTVMCGNATNGDAACVAGICTPKCYGGWFDADLISSNGCECKADNFNGILGDSCLSPLDLGYLYDDGSVTILKTGNIMPGEQGDWFRFKAVDSNDATGSCDPFNVHVWLSGNPDGKFTVDLYKHSCGGTSLLCSNEADTGWTVAFSGQKPYGPQTLQGGSYGVTEKSPIPEIAGECNCVNGTSGLPGMNYCTDNSDDFFVRVGRYPGSGTICQNYTLSITNGK